MSKNTPPRLAAAACAAALALTTTVSAAITSVDLSTYVRVGRYSLPDPSNTTPPPGGNLLAQEASGVTYNPDTDTLFIIGDGARSITQVSKTGAFIDTMTLATGTSPQGTSFYDTEGITYVGGGQFAIVEERYRQVSLITYVAGTTLAIGDPGVQTVKLGTSIGNVGLEGLSYDPFTNGYIFVKELNPQGIFQTTIDFAAGTASNGSPTTINSVNLFDPAMLGVLDFGDTFALSNVIPSAFTAQYESLLILSQESGKIVQTDRSGNILSSLTIMADPGDTLSVADMQHEGLTMDLDGFLYVVNENAGGDITKPELWVYQAVPEPGSAAFLLTGLTVLGSFTRRRKTQRAAR